MERGEIGGLSTVNGHRVTLHLHVCVCVCVSSKESTKLAQAARKGRGAFMECAGWGARGDDGGVRVVGRRRGVCRGCYFLNVPRAAPWKGQRVGDRGPGNGHNAISPAACCATRELIVTSTLKTH